MELVQTSYNTPTIDAQTEYALAASYQKTGDIKAAQKLVLSNLRFVAFIANQYKNYGLPEQDILQEGTIGLMKAVKRFDPERGVRLITFAVHWIRAEIHEYIIKNWRIVKIATTKAQRKLFFKLREATKDVTVLNKAHSKELADTFSVRMEDITTMHRRLTQNDLSLTPKNDDEHTAMQLPAPDADPAEQYAEEMDTARNNTRLHAALATLDPRSKDIIIARWFNDKKATLKTLAERYKVSIERIRQIEQQAMQTLKGHVLPPNA